jgi:hypothetical protein
VLDREDLGALADELGGVTFTIGSASVKGFFARDGEEVLAGEGARQFADKIVARVIAGALEGLEVGATVTVSGTSPLGAHDDDYTVVELYPVRGGLFTEMRLGHE